MMNRNRNVDLYPSFCFSLMIWITWFYHTSPVMAPRRPTRGNNTTEQARPEDCSHTEGKGGCKYLIYTIHFSLPLEAMAGHTPLCL